FSPFKRIAGVPDSFAPAVKSSTTPCKFAGAVVKLVIYTSSVWLAPGLIVRSDRTGEIRNPLPPVAEVGDVVASAGDTPTKSSVVIANSILAEAYILRRNIIAFPSFI